MRTQRKLTSASQIGLSIRNIFTSPTLIPSRQRGTTLRRAVEFADLTVNLSRGPREVRNSRWRARRTTKWTLTNYEAHLWRLEIALSWPSRGGGGILLDVSRHQEGPRRSEVNGQWPHGDVNQLTAAARCNKERRASAHTHPLPLRQYIPPVSRGSILW